MAAISFMPSVNGSGAVANADFEGGFNVTQNGNVFNFSGQWICPVNPIPAGYTQNMVCICTSTGDSAVITATFSFDGSNGNIVGSMTVSTPQTPFGNSGIGAIVANNGNTSFFNSDSNGADAYISAPFLLGHMGETSF